MHPGRRRARRSIVRRMGQARKCKYYKYLNHSGITLRQDSWPSSEVDVGLSRTTPSESFLFHFFLEWFHNVRRPVELKGGVRLRHLFQVPLGELERKIDVVIEYQRHHPGIRAR